MKVHASSRFFASRAARAASALALLSSFGCAADPSFFSLSVDSETPLVPEGTLGVRGWPDQGFAALPASAGVRFVTAAADGSSYLVTGADLQHLDSASAVLAPGGDPRTFDGAYAGLGSVYAAADGTLYGFYQGEDRDDIPAFPSGVAGYYATVALATSADGGATWTKVGPVLTSEQTKPQLLTSKESDGGASDPSVVVSQDGRYLYLYYTEHSRKVGAVAICMARADLTLGPPLPGQFQKLKDGMFTSPGMGGTCSPVINGIGADFSDALQPQVTYSAFAGQYLATFVLVDWYSLQNQDGLGYSGLAYALSSDGVTWSSPSLLVSDLSLPALGAPLVAHGTFLWDDAHQGSGWLVYGGSPAWGAPEKGLFPATLMGRRFQLIEH